MAISAVLTVGVGEALDLTGYGEGLEAVALVGRAAALLSAQDTPRVALKKSKFRKVEEVSSDISTQAEWEEWRAKLRVAMGVRSQATGIALEERSWQMDASTSMLCRRDTTVIAATSDGKSFAYQLLSIVMQGHTILGVFPLLSLQNDQVRSCVTLGIKACALNAQTMEDDPELLFRAARGEYEAVFVTPEFIRADNLNFMKLLGTNGKRSSVFRIRLIAIVIDESHLVFHWRKFRKQYISLGIVRTFFPGTPILTLSATCPPHVRERVHYTSGRKNLRPDARPSS